MVTSAEGLGGQGPGLGVQVLSYSHRVARPPALTCHAQTRAQTETHAPHYTLKSHASTALQFTHVPSSAHRLSAIAERLAAVAELPRIVSATALLPLLSRAPTSRLQTGGPRGSTARCQSP